MNRRWILDGYNVINHWPDLKTLKEESLGLARDELIRLMAEHHAYSGDEATVVFDGAKIEGTREREEEVLGVRVVFSSPTSTADTAIERMVYKEESPSSLIVVTTDSSLRNFILGAGARCLSPQDLEREVNSSLDQIQRYLKPGRRTYAE